MKNYFDEICSKLKKKIKIEDIQIVDNSHKHKNTNFTLRINFILNLRLNLFI